MRRTDIDAGGGAWRRRGTGRASSIGGRWFRDFPPISQDREMDGAPAAGRSGFANPKCRKRYNPRSEQAQR